MENLSLTWVRNGRGKASWSCYDCDGQNGDGLDISGVKGAKYDVLVLTDADCKPASNEWLLEIATRFTAGKEIVLGYGPYMKRAGFLNRLVRFDTAWIGMSYFSMALAKLPYMGVGRNMAYMKELFNRVHGFKSHYNRTTIGVESSGATIIQCVTSNG